MIAIDTNVLVRILVDDPDAPEQCQQARHLVSLQNEPVWIAQIVLVETVWVLESGYGFKKPDIADAIERISSHPVLQLELRQRIEDALGLYRNNTVDFADCLILTAATQQRLILHTFDRKLARLDGVQRLAPL